MTDASAEGQGAGPTGDREAGRETGGDAKVWFITGASRGFGRAWAEAALARGDRVVVTARGTDAFAGLVARHGERVLALELDVADRPAVLAAVERAVAAFGRLDVVVANAGHGLFGAVEETSPEAARRQLDVNVLGVVWLLQAVAPVLRAQRGGRVLVTSSFGGLVSFPTAGLYGASKYAVEGLAESFALEMSDFDVELTLVEPAAYATDFMGSSEQTTAMAAYDGARQRTGGFFARMPPGDPAGTARAILELVDMPSPPLRLLLGAHVLPVVLQTYEERIRTWREHEDRTARAQ